MGYISELRQMVGTRPLIMAGACVLLLDGQNRLLLQQRTDNGLWGLPGGALEPGETMEEVAARELFEETGLKAGELKLLDVFSGADFYYRYPHGDEVHNVVAAFVCRQYEGTVRTDGDEVAALTFFDRDRIPADLSPPDAPIIRAFLRTLPERQTDVYAPKAENIVQAQERDLDELMEMCLALWPEEDREELRTEYVDMLQSPKHQVLMGRDENRFTGFVHVAVRSDPVEGADSYPVGFVEGIYVKPPYRRQGLAAALLREAERWVESLGLRQIGSDIYADNLTSYDFHTRCGFREAGRLIAFMKELDSP